MSGFRLGEGGRIDRSQPVSFSFDGLTYQGYAGDTLASALLANGVSLFGRSFKYHRPRGLLGAGSEEPNALVSVSRGPGRHTPNLRATAVEIYEGLTATSQNRWPSLKTDIGAINDRLGMFLPAGFYNKTFMWPRSFWDKLYEPLIRRAAGLGESPSEEDPDRYKLDAHRLESLAERLSGSELLSWLDRSTSFEDTADLQASLEAIASNPQFKYSRLFAIGLFSLLEKADADMVKDQETRNDAIAKVSAALHLPEDKVSKDLDLYRSNLEKMAQARIVLQDVIQAERKKREKRDTKVVASPSADSSDSNN